MPSVDRILALKLIGDVGSIDKTLKGTTGKISRFASSAKSWGTALAAGLAIDAIGAATDALGNAWDGFREGQRASEQLAVSWGNLGLPADELASTIERIGDRAKELGQDDTAAIDAFNASLKNTGDASESWDRLAIAWDLVANGAAPDVASAMKLIEAASRGSAKVVDKFGLTADTAAGRVAQLRDRVAGAAEKANDLDPLGNLFNDLNEDLEGIVGSLATGDLDGALLALQTVGTDLGDAWDAVAPAIGTALDKMTDGAWSGFVDDVGPKFADILDRIATLWSDTLAPALQTGWEVIQPILAAFGAVFGTVLTVIQGGLETISKLLEGDFSGAWTAAQTTVDTVLTDMQTIIGDLVTALTGILEDVATAAYDIGDAIWNGIIDGLTGLGQTIIDNVTDGIKEGLNALIRIWNDLQLPGAGFDFPGISIDFDNFHHVIAPAQRIELWGPMALPNIEELAQGGIVRGGRGGALALIGEGAHDEAVIPLDGRSMGGNVFNITIAGVVADPVAAGRQVVELIKGYERRDGRAWRS